ncbi:hypothetical protein N9A51_01395 [Pseudomonadales bacterium]|nr:hypothetical protein [Pseudomonadales bacterium]
MNYATRDKPAIKIQLSSTHKRIDVSTKAFGSHPVLKIKAAKTAHDTPTPFVSCNVELSPLLMKVMLSLSQAALLTMLEASGRSISTLELADAGFTKIDFIVYQLTEMGALIETTDGEVLCNNDYTHHGVTHYRYKGWKVEITSEKFQDQVPILCRHQARPAGSQTVTECRVL